MNMSTFLSNAIIILVVLILVVFGIKNTVAHMKGEGSCCGGGGKGTWIKPKKLAKVISVKTVMIEGMMCDNCARRIHNALNSIDGVNAKVQRSKNRAVIKLGKNVEDSVIKKAITDLGYKVK